MLECKLLQAWLTHLLWNTLVVGIPHEHQHFPTHCRKLYPTFHQGTSPPCPLWRWFHPSGESLPQQYKELDEKESVTDKPLQVKSPLHNETTTQHVVWLFHYAVVTWLAVVYQWHSPFHQVPCTVEGEIRLRDGTTSREGRVEMCLGGTWGTICDSGWGNADARVVCRQLGYSTIGVLIMPATVCTQAWQW